VFKQTHAVWTLSEDESAEMRTEFPEFGGLFRAVAQPYITPSMHHPLRALAISDNRIVLSIARMTEQKRLDRLIRAFAHVRTKGARLLIVGEGEDRLALESLVLELGLTGRVDMPGYLPDVALALHSASLFVLTSDYEGLPAAIIEAMAANCPVLSTDCFPSARSLLSNSPACAIIDDVAPEPLARQIDQALTIARPTELNLVTQAYSITNGVASHVRCLRDLLDAHRVAS
jgi:glycosyltransferase involved in cell wall biosynthesis